MSTSSKGVRPVPPKTGLRAPVGRLASLKNSHPVTIKRPQAITRSQAPRPPKPTQDTCPNPDCPAPRIVDEDGQRVCSGCGTVVRETNIVSEVTFGETSSGAAIVQGTYVGADQSHGRSFGPGFQRGGGMESREITEQNGNRYIQQMARALYIPESATKAAGQVFKLAVGLNFIQGRRTRIVAAVCLYIACRRQEGNTIMLIDLADVMMINVFKLGRAYKALLDELRLGGTVFMMNPIDPESLIYRFAKQLEFNTSTMHVASDAVRIVQRMNRDWMTTGRRPAGICGAALILAARMNNFRRTVREVVYVVKVTEITINQRLNEFSSTQSGNLTVDQFRSMQLENAHDPPAFSQSKGRKSKNTSVKREVPETAADTEDDDDSTEPSPPAKKKRMDADGFVVPDLPVDPALLRQAPIGTPTIDSLFIKASGRKGKEPEDVADVNRNSTKTSSHQTKKPRIDSSSFSMLDELVDDASSEGEGFSETPTVQDGCRPKRTRSKKVPPRPPTAEELAAEEALENEMNEFLLGDSNMVQSAAKSSRVPEPPAHPPPPRKPVSEKAEIDETEFDSDPEVANCLLSIAEVEMKERIWVHENKDYLRSQQAKALKQALTQTEGPDQGTKPRRRRKGRLGDVTYLEGGDGYSSRASTPAEATRRMLEQRGFSKKINYKLLESLYGEEGAKEVAKPRAESESRNSRSRSQSILSRRSVSSEPPARPAAIPLDAVPSTTPAITNVLAPATAAVTRPPAAILASQKLSSPVEEIVGPVLGKEVPPPDTRVGENDEDNEDMDDDDNDDDMGDGEDHGRDHLEAAFLGKYNNYDTYDNEDYANDDYYDQGSDYDYD